MQSSPLCRRLGSLAAKYELHAAFFAPNNDDNISSLPQTIVSHPLISKRGEISLQFVSSRLSKKKDFIMDQANNTAINVRQRLHFNGRSLFYQEVSQFSVFRGKRK